MTNQYHGWRAEQAARRAKQEERAKFKRALEFVEKYKHLAATNSPENIDKIRKEYPELLDDDYVKKYLAGESIHNEPMKPTSSTS